MMTVEGWVKILDFGLARFLERGEASEAPTLDSEVLRTRDGFILGTVPYMSRSRRRGRRWTRAVTSSLLEAFSTRWSRGESPSFEQLASRDILSFEVHLYLARCHRLEGKLAEAILLLQRDEVDAAIAAFERAVALRPADEMFLRNLRFARGIRTPREK